MATTVDSYHETEGNLSAVMTDGERADDELNAPRTDDYNDADEDDDEEDEEVTDEDVNRETELWDEGGSSHCGYNETVHATLMTVGKVVHTVVGDPAEETENGPMRSVGNWFQEASYAVRDIIRGNHGAVAKDLGETMTSVKQDLMDTSSVVSGAFGGGGSVTGTVGKDVSS